MSAGTFSQGSISAVVVRGGFSQKAAWGSLLRHVPSAPVATVQNHFRTTYEVESTSPMSKDDLVDLSCFATFAGLLVFLGKVDLVVLLFAELISSEHAHGSDSVFVNRWRALGSCPLHFFAGSMGFHSMLGRENFGAGFEEISKILDVRSSAIRQLARLHWFCESLTWMEFLFGFSFLLPLYTTFLPSGESGVGGGQGVLAWMVGAAVPTSSSYLVGWFLSLPDQSIRILRNPVFAYALDGAVKKAVEGALRHISDDAKEFDAGILNSIGSEYVPTSTTVPLPGSPSSLHMTVDMSVRAFEIFGKWTAKCESAVPDCDKSPSRATCFGMPTMAVDIVWFLQHSEAGSAACRTEFLDLIRVGTPLDEPLTGSTVLALRATSDSESEDA